MKNKKGFMIIETAIVLVVVIVALTLALTSYSIIVRKSDEKKHFNKVSDMYMLYTISQLGKNDSEYGNYVNLANKLQGENIPGFWVDENNCDNKNSYFLITCDDLFSIFSSIENIGIITDVEEIIHRPSDYDAFDNGTVSFLETLKKYEEDTTIKKRYLIARINRNQEFYYAAIEIGRE